jgi:hypothetical protein
MAKLALSTKRIQIDKANLTIVVVTSIAAFVTVFCLVGSKALLDQRAYQSKVISKKEIAKKQLTENIQAVDSLVNSYKAFTSGPLNLIGGLTTGTGDRDGDNAKIVLDALPSKYDFPALASSLEKMVQDNGTQIVNIQGTDDELNQEGNRASVTPQPVEMPFEVSVRGNYSAIQNLISVFEKSIRPFPIQSISISGKDSQISLDIKAKTYYQPEKSLNIKSETVK